MNKQITEDYVSFEIAKLLKEKGFNELCFALYNPEEELIQCGVRLSNTQVGRVPGSYSAPTHQMALKWLREVHKLHIKVCYDIQLKWYYDIISLKETVSFDYEEMKCYHNEFDFDSYEQAVEAAIKYTLENLI